MKISYAEFCEGIWPSASKYQSKYEQKYPMTEKKPKYKSTYMPQTEYRPRYRPQSAEKYSASQYVSPKKSYYEQSYKSPYKTVLKPSFLDEEEETRQIAKKLEYSMEMSPTKKLLIDDKLSSTFQEQLKSLRKIESYKQDLAHCPDFNMMDAYDYLCGDCKGPMSLMDFCNGLKGIGLYPSYHETSLLFNRYASPYKKEMSYSNFCNMVRPKNPLYDMKMKGHYYTGSVPFSSTTNLYFKLLMESHLEAEKQNEMLKEKLKISPSFNVYDAFHNMDVLGKGKLHITDVLNVY
jgi:hypothetical protein